MNPTPPLNPRLDAEQLHRRLWTVERFDKFLAVYGYRCTDPAMRQTVLEVIGLVGRSYFEQMCTLERQGISPDDSEGRIIGHPDINLWHMFGWSEDRDGNVTRLKYVEFRKTGQSSNWNPFQDMWLLRAKGSQLSKELGQPVLAKIRLNS